MTTYIQQGSYIPSSLIFIHMSLKELINFIHVENVDLIMAYSGRECNAYFELAYNSTHESLVKFLRESCKYYTMRLVYAKDSDGNKPKDNLFKVIGEDTFRVWFEELVLPIDNMIASDSFGFEMVLTTKMQPISIHWLAARIHQAKSATTNVHTVIGTRRVRVDKGFPLSHSDAVTYLENLTPTQVYSVVGELDIIHFMMNSTGAFFYSYEKDSYDEG